MGTITTKIGNIFAEIKKTYKELGEYDVEDVDLNTFDNLKTASISKKDFDDLKRSMDEVDAMAKNYYVKDKNYQRKSNLKDVSNSEQGHEFQHNKVKTDVSKEKDRED